MGGDVWMPDLYQKSSRMRRMALQIWRKYIMRISVAVLSIIQSRVHVRLLLRNLNEDDDKPAPGFSPQLSSCHLSEDFHILQDRKPS